MKKKFIITIDTEGDNLWAWKQGDTITTENTLYLQRFQSLCNKFGFKPVWLSNYEMLSDSRFVDFVCGVEQEKTGELGMHLHAWNTPPDFALTNAKSGAPYLIEYPEPVMEAKIRTMTELIKNRTGITPVSHRAGRWATNRAYFELLEKYGYKVDCSVTPHISWIKNIGQTENSHGSDYRSFSEEPYKIGGLLEVPVTVRMSHALFFNNVASTKDVARSVYHAMKGTPLWLRPNGHNRAEMRHLIDTISASETDYIMFMLHSSELMPGGSPTFKNEADIEALYLDLEDIFFRATKTFEGVTLREYERLF